MDAAILALSLRAMANVAFLIAGLLLGILGLVGFLNSVRGTPVKKVVGFGSELPSIGDPAFRAAMERVSHTTMTEGNVVEVFWNGDQTYPRLWEDLRAAKRSITLQQYYVKPGRMAEELSAILIERARAGVTVLFLYDWFGSSIKKEFIKRLRDAGVRAERFRPIALTALNKLQHRSHIRIVCVDSTVGWTGGFGIDDKWYGDGRSKDQWRDSNVRFTGPAVDQLQAAFEACWAESTGELFISPSGTKPDSPKGPTVAGLLHGSPSIGSTEAERFLVYAIASARERLYFTNSYFVPDRDIRAMLIGAVRRGVDVRVLTVSDATDIKSTWYAGRARYEQLLRGGVRIYEYQPVMMHAKTIVADGLWSAVGTMNADNRSLSFNEETVLMMLDKNAAAVVERHFMSDVGFADEIRLESFRKRGLSDRIKENVCYAFWRIL